MESAKLDHLGVRPLGESEAALYAGVSARDVRKAMREGRLMWKRMGRERVTSRPWIEEWLNA
jgi:hypothetical protein